MVDRISARKGCETPVFSRRVTHVGIANENLLCFGAACGTLRREQHRCRPYQPRKAGFPCCQSLNDFFRRGGLRMEIAAPPHRSMRCNTRNDRYLLRDGRDRRVLQ